MICCNAKVYNWQYNENGVYSPVFTRSAKAERVNPFVDWKTLNHALPCGYCIHCLKRRSKDWTFRLWAEKEYGLKDSAFVTLTYSKEQCAERLNNLVYRDVQLFFKRLRKRLKGIYIKYFIAGEYGSRRGLPHWHIILFGVPWVVFNPQPAELKGRRCENGTIAKSDNYVSALISKCWSGSHRLGMVNAGAISYVSGYLVNKDRISKIVRPDSFNFGRKYSKIMSLYNDPDSWYFAYERLKGGNCASKQFYDSKRYILSASGRYFDKVDMIERMIPFNRSSKNLGADYYDILVKKWAFHNFSDKYLQELPPIYIQGKRYNVPNYYTNRLKKESPKAFKALLYTRAKALARGLTYSLARGKYSEYVQAKTLEKQINTCVRNL